MTIAFEVMAVLLFVVLASFIVMIRNKHAELLLTSYIAVEDEELVQRPFVKILVNNIPQLGKIVFVRVHDSVAIKRLVPNRLVQKLQILIIGCVCLIMVLSIQQYIAQHNKMSKLRAKY